MVTNRLHKACAEGSLGSVKFHDKAINIPLHVAHRVMIKRKAAIFIDKEQKSTAKRKGSLCCTQHVLAAIPNLLLNVSFFAFGFLTESQIRSGVITC